jgi:hypothetical protein
VSTTVRLPEREVPTTSVAATRSIPTERIVTPVVEVPNFPLTKFGTIT